jgi:DNA repair exonuclease SbcCD ATPase subunit
MSAFKKVADKLKKSKYTDTTYGAVAKALNQKQKGSTLGYGNRAWNSRERRVVGQHDSSFLTAFDDPTRDNSTLKSQRQPWLLKAGAGIGRVGAKVAAEVAKMPGVAGGIVLGTYGQIKDGITDQDNTDFMQTAFNNGWIQAVNDANEWVNEEVLPVHVKKSVKEGNLWDNVTSLDFWATEGADGLGYIISMLAPGAAINRLNLGSKLFKAGAETVKGAGKYVNMGQKVDKALNSMSSAGINSKNANLLTSTIANTLFEAGAEAQSAMDNFAKDPEHQEAIQKRSNQIYRRLLQEYQEKGMPIEGGENVEGNLEGGKIPSEEDYLEQLRSKALDQAKRELSSEVGRDVFLFNTAVLIGPNAIMSKIIWGGKNLNKAAKQVKEGGEIIAEETPSFAKKAGRVLGDIGKAGAREGFFEEGMQSTGEEYISSTYGKGGDWSNYSIGAFGEAYGHMLQTTEGQKAILLGAVFGGGMQAYQGAKHREQIRDRKNELIELANEELKNGYSILNEDIYKKDADGDIIFKKINGKKYPVYDEEAIKSKIASDDKMEQLSLAYDAAVEQGDTEKIEMIQSIVATNMVAPFITDENLGVEILRQHLEKSADLAKIAERQGVEKSTLIEKLMAKAEHLKEAQTTFTNYAQEVLQLENEDATPEQIKNIYNRLNSNYITSKSQEQFLKSKVKEKNDALDKLLESMGRSRTDFDSNGALANELESTDVRIQTVLADLRSYENLLKTTEEALNKFWNPKAAQKMLNDLVKEAKQAEKDAEKEQEAEEVIEEINTAKTEVEVDAISNGERIDKAVTAAEELEKAAQRHKEETTLKTITDRVEANPSIDNLEKALKDIKNLGLNSYKAKQIVKAIEKRIADKVKAQEQFREFLAELQTVLTKGVQEVKDKITSLDKEIALHTRRRNKIINDLQNEDKSPKGRNAKLIKQLIAETEAEIKKVDALIESLTKERNKLERDIIDLEEQLGDLGKASEYIETRFDQVEQLDFTSVEDIIDYLKENQEHFGKHRFDINRLLTHKFYTEQNIDGLNSTIAKLEDYKDVLEQTLASLQEIVKDFKVVFPNQYGNDINFLKAELKKTNNEIATAKKELKQERDKLERLERSILDNKILKALTEELQFWEKLQDTKHKYKPSIVFNNPIVAEAARSRKEKISKRKAEEEERLQEEAEKERELSEEYAAQKEAEGLEVDNYIDYISNNFSEGEQIPPPPADVLPEAIQEAEGGFFLNKVEASGVSLRRGKNKNFKLSKRKGKPRKVTKKDTDAPAVATKPLHNTEGAVVERVIEEGENLPKDKDGNVLEQSLSKVNNDAKVITGTDSKKGLSFVSQAAIDFERAPRNKKNQVVTFEINTKYTEGKQGEAIKLLSTAGNVKANNNIGTELMSHMIQGEYTNSKAVIKGVLEFLRAKGYPVKSMGFDGTNLIVTNQKDEDVNIPFDATILGSSRAEVSVDNVSFSEALNSHFKNDFKSRKALSEKEIEFLIDHLPMNVILDSNIPDAKAPLETLTNKEAYNEVFKKSSRQLREAIIKEHVLNGTPIDKISTTIAGQKPGSIQVAPKKKGTVAENSILELHEIGGKFANLKISNLYVVNDRGKLENYKGNIHGSAKTFHPGEVYLMIHTANGSPFPLKLNIKKTTEAEAELLYEIYKYRFEVGIEKGKGQPIRETSQAVQDKVREVFKKELAEDGLFTKNGKPFEDLTIKDIVDFLIWDGTKSIKSQIRFDTKHLKVFGDIYTREEFMQSKEAFVQAVTENKRRNIAFKRSGDETASSFNFENPAYVEYIIENKILNTNALTGKDYPHTFQGDTSLYLKTNGVKVQQGADKVLSQFNVGKAISFKDVLRGSLAQLKKSDRGLFDKTLILVDQGYYTERGNPKSPKYERVTHVTAKKKQSLDAPRYYNAAKRGDVVDALFRDFFSVGYKSEADFIKDGKKKLKQVNKERNKHGDIRITPSAFRELYQIMQEYAIEFRRKGYTVYSTTNPLYGKLKKGNKATFAAGSMDFLIKDKKGRTIIIDIKTSTVDRAADYKKEDSMYREKDALQQNAYRELYFQRTKKKVNKILILPITARASKNEGEINSTYRGFTRTSEESGFIEVDITKDIYELMGETPISSEDKRNPVKVKAEQRNKNKNQSYSNTIDMSGLPAYNGTQAMEDFPDLDVEGNYDTTDESYENVDSIEGGLPDLDIKSIYNSFGVEEGNKILKQMGIEVKPSKTDKKPTVTKKEGEDTKKSPEKIRKSGEKDVFLQDFVKAVANMDISKVTDQQAKVFLGDIARTRSLGTLGREIRGIVRSEKSQQVALEKALKLLAEKASANEDVKSICRNIKQAIK